ncbi:polypyrimidine tract-binding protein 3 [Indicator indicator]|uniref:polypyrimidine tract-binding protein 3 n=1 Tax=Indicator indicator TaxID=1002788 RepID=UPI0023DF64CB|nr:polypyrimidine tract-binding protein 3 [Indicator indicator]
MSSSKLTTDGGNKKKSKTERMPRIPSRVLHLCQLPHDVTNAEVVSLGLPFGEVTNVLLLKRKNQAFLEMASEEAAVNMVKHYTPGGPILRRQPIYIQYSNYKELQTSHLPSQAKGQAALQAVKSGHLAATSALAAEGGRNPIPGAVLRIIVENPFYPITIEMLHQIFSRFGSVLKIIIFSKNDKFQVLLEYANPMNACCAKMVLNGQNIFNSCCILHIEFSRLSSLKVKYNNNKSRDFTRFDLPCGDVQSYMESSATPAFGTQNAILPSYAGAAGFIQPMGFMQSPGLPYPVVPVPGSVSVTTEAVPGLSALHNVVGIPESSVLLVRNFNSEAITIHGLFTLFGVYGNVLRVKIMLKNRETALIQMMDEVQAHLAVNHLNGQRIYGRVLQVSLAEYQAVQWEPEDQELVEDYSNSPLHRFKNPGSKNSQNISPPSETLHLCCIPSFATADELKKLFARTGSTVKAFRFFERDCKMALIQMGSVEEAIQALIELHNHDFGENHHLRISFSTMTI